MVFADAILLVDEALEVLRVGCFKYFQLGGECVNGPVSLLSGYVTLFFFIFILIPTFSSWIYRITPSFALLFRHFFTVAFYSIWVMFTHPQPRKLEGTDKTMFVVPGFDEYPYLIVKSFQVVSGYCPFKFLFMVSDVLVW